ncbi:MAG TPA: ABC transporter permease, partial [Blastocatellia bacterium]|nr:ABC transporter permease [Blastocatellia bacterium]
AITVVLASSAAFVALSFRSLENIDLGFDPANVLTAEVSLRGPSYGTAGQRREWQRQLIERLENHPEIAAVGMDLIRPLEGRIGWDVPYQADGQSVQDVLSNPVPNFEIITPHYFRAMGIKIVAGREFSELDKSDGLPVVIISRSAARQFFGDENAVGKRIKLGGFQADSPWLKVVGVVADVRYRALDDPRLDVYVPYTQRNFPVRYIMIRMNSALGTPADATTILRQEVAALDSAQAVNAVTTSEAMVQRALARPRFAMIVIGAFAVIAGFLAMIGIYGIVSYNVSERTQEIGIRMALGAPSGRVLGMISAGSLGLTVAGIGAGVLGAVIAARLMSGLLYGVHSTDPIVLGAISMLMLIVSQAAAYFPARRAAKIDPAVALRAD